MNGIPPLQRPYEPGQTIAAICTPPGVGGVAIVRISGSDAIQVASRLFSRPLEQMASHTVAYGAIRSTSGEHIDDVLLVLMRGPRSFTGEDTIEIQCHGGSLIPKKIVQAAIDAGAKAALPGEFSMKAYLNGKIDLAQAEAIQTLISSRNETAWRIASQQLAGALSEKIADFQSRLTAVAAIIEAWVDFPEEGLEFASFEQIIDDLGRLIGDVRALIASFEQGRMASEGIALCLVGAPNVGKSSLMNALLGKERAIVSPIPGTTRDLVEDDLKSRDLHFRLIDTAGIRKTEELIEEEGIRRSRAAIMDADLVLYVRDASCPHDALWQELPQEKTIVVWNKIDVAHARPLPELPFVCHVELSARTKQGVDQLFRTIEQMIWEKGTPRLEEVVITSLRHKEALEMTAERCLQAQTGLTSSVSAEFVASDIRQALIHLGSIIGTNVTEDIINSVFTTFCIGK